jgi:hypothetical protein
MARTGRSDDRECQIGAIRVVVIFAALLAFWPSERFAKQDHQHLP